MILKLQIFVALRSTFVAGHVFVELYIVFFRNRWLFQSRFNILELSIRWNYEISNERTNQLFLTSKYLDINIIIIIQKCRQIVWAGNIYLKVLVGVEFFLLWHNLSTLRYLRCTKLWAWWRCVKFIWFFPMGCDKFRSLKRHTVPVWSRKSRTRRNTNFIKNLPKRLKILYK